MRSGQPNIEIVPARAIHIREIARRMRDADRLEVSAASGKSPFDALAFSLRRSAYAWTALVNGRPEVMFGVADLNLIEGSGAVWLLGTDAVEKYSRIFLRMSRDFRRQLLARYIVLRNFVHADNRVSIRWLEWMGAKFGEPIDWNGHAFRMFEMRAEDV